MNARCWPLSLFAICVCFASGCAPSEEATAARKPSFEQLYWTGPCPEGSSQIECENFRQAMSTAQRMINNAQPECAAAYMANVTSNHAAMTMDSYTVNGHTYTQVGYTQPGVSGVQITMSHDLLNGDQYSIVENIFHEGFHAEDTTNNLDYSGSYIGGAYALAADCMSGYGSGGGPA